MGYHIITPNTVAPIPGLRIHMTQPSFLYGYPPVPKIISASPNPISQGSTLTITVQNLPGGFTLNSITLGGEALGSPTKTDETTITGQVGAGHTIDTDQVIVITYNTNKTLTSASVLVEVTA